MWLQKQVIFQNGGQKVQKELLGKNLFFGVGR